MAAATVGLVAAAPVMTLVALLIRSTSPGPVIYAQTRVGIDRRNGGPNAQNCRRRSDLGGRPFAIYKFRSMYHSASSADEQVWAKPDDPRVTPVGRFIRKFRLDELPQLFNVLKGDMNVVGPRPEQPEIFAALRGRVDGYTWRQTVLPGITGWAQVNHRYDRSIDDVRRKVAFDLEYIAHRSVLSDMVVMLRTVPTVIFQRGAW
jgi:lipopolysaccharide/colanic/teichoic acid biosynthesis glycosyltransferase